MTVIRRSILLSSLPTPSSRAEALGGLAALRGDGVRSRTLGGLAALRGGGVRSRTLGGGEGGSGRGTLECRETEAAPRKAGVGSEAVIRGTGSSSDISISSSSEESAWVGQGRFGRRSAGGTLARLAPRPRPVVALVRPPPRPREPPEARVVRLAGWGLGAVRTRWGRSGSTEESDNTACCHSLSSPPRRQRASTVGVTAAMQGALMLVSNT